MIDLALVPEAVRANKLRLLARALPYGHVRFGEQFVSPSPYAVAGKAQHDDITVDRNGQWRDRAGRPATSGGDVVDLLAHVGRASRRATIAKLARELSPADLHADTPVRAADHLSDRHAAATDAGVDVLVKAARYGTPRQRADALFEAARAATARHFRRCR